MNSRRSQDVILRLLADGPFRAAALENRLADDPELAALLSKIDLPALDRFGRFLCRHFFRERVVHYFKYSRALSPLTNRSPESALKTPQFNALMPMLILGERTSAVVVLHRLKRFLTENADSIRSFIPYWDDLVAYQGAFFISDAMPPSHAPRPFTARSTTSTILELSWDVPAVLPSLLQPFKELPMPPQKATRLLFARSPQGEVTALRCTESLKTLLDNLTGEEDPVQVAARIGIDSGSLDKALRQLEQLGAVVAQESFSSSHRGSEVSQT